MIDPDDHPLRHRRRRHHLQECVEHACGAHFFVAHLCECLVCGCADDEDGQQQLFIEHLRVPRRSRWWVRLLVNPLGIPAALTVGCMIALQIPLVCIWTGVSWHLFVRAYLGTYLVVLLLLLRCACDCSESCEDFDEDASLPRRVMWCSDCRKYRDGYDHHDYLVGNCVMRSNERQFVFMCVGFTFLYAWNVFTDVFLLAKAMGQQTRWQKAVVLGHAVYSILRLRATTHYWVCFLKRVCQNQTTYEFRHAHFDVVRFDDGETTVARELSDDTFNEEFDNLEYAPELNEFDHGGARNCWSFWCGSR